MENKIKTDEKVVESLNGFPIELDCVIIDKVFASCQQRECFTELEYEIDCASDVYIKFKPGFIVPNTLIVTDIPGEDSFRRVRFTVRVPFEVYDEGELVFEGFLPDIFKDVVLYLPEARDEFEFRIVIETSSDTLGTYYVSNGVLTMTVGTFIIIKVVGTVQLLIPTLGYCPEPPYCDDYSPEDICEDFYCEDFPEFFPPQLPFICAPRDVL